jgi:nitrite reductase (NO-forming)
VITLVTEEKLGQLADGVTYDFWTFNGTVPGPLIRLRLNQTVEMHIVNLPNSTMTHSIDSHAILGPGGGGAISQTPPGQESIFQFKALRAGLFMYHCATPDIPTHIANGMYGMILVEPLGGLPKVDREFYIAQGEFYTQGPFGQQGFQGYSFQKADAETPDYVVFNGRVGSLTGNRSLQAKVGETVRIFFLNAGPNLDSSFHVIGGILDRVYLEGSIISPPLLNVQTTLVPAGGSVMVEFTAEVPGKLTIVDHSLFRIHHGALGIINVIGPSNPSIYSSIKNATITGNMSMPNMNETTTENSTLPTPTGTTSNTTIVTILNSAYLPAQLTITVGTTVTWINKDSIGHTVTEGDPNSPTQPALRTFDSSGQAGSGQVSLLQPGQSWSYTFTTPGTYNYYCIVHPYMTGQITVLPAAGSNSSQGYGDLTNFEITLNGKDLLGMCAFGIIVLVALMLILSRSGRKEGETT